MYNTDFDSNFIIFYRIFNFFLLNSQKLLGLVPVVPPVPPGLTSDLPMYNWLHKEQRNLCLESLSLLSSIKGSNLLLSILKAGLTLLGHPNLPFTFCLPASSLTTLLFSLLLPSFITFFFIFFNFDFVGE